MEKERFKDIKVGDYLYEINFDTFKITRFNVCKIKHHNYWSIYWMYKVTNNKRIDDSLTAVSWMTRATSFKSHVFAVNMKVAIDRLNEYKREYIFLWKKNANNLQNQLAELKEKINDLKEKEVQYEE